MITHDAKAGGSPDASPNRSRVPLDAPIRRGNTEMNVCNEYTLCSYLSEFIEVDEDKPGFHLWREVECGRLITKGVVYKSKGRKRMTILNRCPWCEAELKWGMTTDAK